MSTLATDLGAERQHRPHFGPYALDTADILDPPAKLPAILKKIGPGIVLSASIVGSGELIATTPWRAKVGYTTPWLIILSCLFKSAVQSFLGRYAIASTVRAPRSIGSSGAGPPSDEGGQVTRRGLPTTGRGL